MYWRDEEPMSSRFRDIRDELGPDDAHTDMERDQSTGAYHRVTHYRDGSTTYHFGGPVGSVSYDEYGEEC